MTRLHISCHRYIKGVLQTSHVYISLSQTQQLCLTDITRLHMACHRHINYVLQTSQAYICIVTDTVIVSYRHHTSTYILSETQQLYLTHITRLHISCHRHSNCVLQTLHVYICLVTDTSVVSYRHHTPTFVTDSSIVSYTHHMPTCLVTDTSIVS